MRTRFSALAAAHPAARSDDALGPPPPPAFLHLAGWHPLVPRAVHPPPGPYRTCRPRRPWPDHADARWVRGVRGGAAAAACSLLPSAAPAALQACRLDLLGLPAGPAGRWPAPVSHRPVLLAHPRPPPEEQHFLRQLRDLPLTAEPGVPVSQQETAAIQAALPRLMGDRLPDMVRQQHGVVCCGVRRQGAAAWCVCYVPTVHKM